MPKFKIVLVLPFITGSCSWSGSLPVCWEEDGGKIICKFNILTISMICLRKWERSWRVVFQICALWIRVLLRTVVNKSTATSEELLSPFYNKLSQDFTIHRQLLVVHWGCCQLDQTVEMSLESLCCTFLLKRQQWSRFVSSVSSSASTDRTSSSSWALWFWLLTSADRTSSCWPSENIWRTRTWTLHWPHTGTSCCRYCVL